MSDIKPCAECQVQETMLRRDVPHENLSYIAGKSVRGSMFGGHEEYIYRCRNCGVLMYHMDDKNDFMPYWYIVSELPEWVK